MNSGTIAKLPLILTTAFIVGLVAYFRLGAARRELNSRDEVTEFARGDIPPVPGEPLLAGNVKIQKYEKVELGVAKFVDMSEDGAILLELPVEKNHVEHAEVPYQSKLRKTDGQVVTYPINTIARITPSGQIYEIVIDQSRNYSVKLNGKEIYRRRSATGSVGNSPALSDLLPADTAYTDEGIILGTGLWLPPAGGEWKALPGKKGEMFLNCRGSSQMGAVFVFGSSTRYSNLLTYERLAVMKNGALTFYNAPENIGRETLVATRDTAYKIRSGPNRASRLYRFANGVFAPQPVIPGSVGMWLWSANSRGEILLDAKFPKKPGAYPYSDATYLVRGPFFYPLADIASSVGIRGVVKPAGNSGRCLDEKGNMVLAVPTGGRGERLVLLKWVGR